MPGEIQKIIEKTIEARGGNDSIVVRNAIETKFILRGVDPHKYSPASPDDPTVLQRVMDIAKSMGVSVESRTGIPTAFSVKPSVEEAVREIGLGLKGAVPKLVVFFASPSYPPADIAKKMQEAFPSAETVGCTTAGEIVTGQMLKHSVVAMALTSEVVSDLKVCLLKNIRENPAAEAVKEPFESHFKEPLRGMDVKKYVGIVLLDGMSRVEEKVVESLGNLTDVFFAGASAGDDLKFSQTHVFHGGRAHADAAVLILLKPGVPFEVFKTQSMSVLDKKLVATKVDEDRRLVVEFDGKPALDAYAAALGVTPQDAPKSFNTHPLGLVTSQGDPYVRSPQRAEGKSMFFFCNIKEGSVMSILQSGDIIERTRADIAEKAKAGKPFSSLLNFNCIQRTLELENKKQTRGYADVFASVPTVGFSTYGEVYLGFVNQTSTILAFR